MQWWSTFSHLLLWSKYHCILGNYIFRNALLCRWCHYRQQWQWHLNVLQQWYYFIWQNHWIFRVEINGTLWNCAVCSPFIHGARHLPWDLHPTVKVAVPSNVPLRLSFNPGEKAVLTNEVHSEPLVQEEIWMLNKVFFFILYDRNCLHQKTKPFSVRLTVTLLQTHTCYFKLTSRKLNL